MSNACFHIPVGFYPQQLEPEKSGAEQFFGQWANRLYHRLTTRLPRAKRLVTQVDRYEAALHDCSLEELKQQLIGLRADIRRSGLHDDIMAQVFARIRAGSGQVLSMRHYPHQIIGAWAMLRGQIIEMDTGEGKSLCATLAAAAAAVAGVPTHVITVNEYLAERDAEKFQPLYDALGISVSFVGESMDEAEKKAAYRHDVVYCTNKQVAFDYLRDRIRCHNETHSTRLQSELLLDGDLPSEGTLLQGLGFAIIDEVDSVLIDEAVTPLVISASKKENKRINIYRRAMRLANALEQGRDFLIEPESRSVQLTLVGKKSLKQQTDKLGGLWLSESLSHYLVLNALKATFCFLINQHYIVVDKKIVIVDEFTGRTMSDRSWESGLHQMIELKEECELTPEKETLAKISYQQFFSRYINLAGMTGTAKEVRSELCRVFNKTMFRVPRRQKNRVIFEPPVFLRTHQEKWQYITHLTAELAAEGKALLLGTRSVQASMQLHEHLTQQGIHHQLLNAEHHEKEADMIAQAGQLGAVTIATNMAGRGTDIDVAPEVKDLGGLHVIATEKQDSFRVDRQLFGRSGRQGDPGKVYVILSLEDEVLSKELPPMILTLLSGLHYFDSILSRKILAMAFESSQKRMERRQYLARMSSFKRDKASESLVAFGGGVE